MNDGLLKNSITYILLFIFITVKMTGLHAWSHIDDNDHAIHCTFCDHSVSNNLTPALTPNLQNFTIKNFELIVQNEIANNYKFSISGIIASAQLFSRPPPFSL